MAENKNNKSHGVDTTKILSHAVQGRSFLTFDFFKNNWIYIVAATVMTLMHISNKYTCQECMSEIMELKTTLNNTKTDCVDISAQYNSMIRESQMSSFIDTLHLGLCAPEQPPYKLVEK